MVWNLSVLGRLEKLKNGVVIDWLQPKDWTFFRIVLDDSYSLIVGSGQKIMEELEKKMWTVIYV